MATYRVSPTLGVDSAGRDGSISNPWATWAYLDTRVSAAAGDIYLQDAGTVARENIPNSIIAADNITLDVYGDSDYATVSGFVQVFDWTYNATYGLWEKSVADGWNVSIDGRPLTFVAWNTDLATTAALMGDWSFSHDTASAMLYIKAPENPGGCEVAQREFVLGQWTSTNVGLVVRGFNIIGGWRHGIYTTGKNGMLVEQGRVAQCGGDWAGSFYLGNGIEVYGTCTGVVVRDMLFEDIFDSGLSPQLSSTAGQSITGFTSLRNTFRRCGYAGFEGTFNGTTQTLRGHRVEANLCEDIGKNCWAGNRGGRAITFSNNASSSTDLTEGCVVVGNTIRRSVRGVRMVNTQGANVIASNRIEDCDYGLVSYQGLNAAGHVDRFDGNLLVRCTVGLEIESSWADTVKVYNNTFIDCPTGVKNTSNSNAAVTAQNNAFKGSGTAFNVTVGTLTETTNRLDTTITAGKTLDATDMVMDLSEYMADDGRLRVPYMLDGVPMLNPLGGAGTYVQGVRLMDGQRAQPGRTPIGAFALGRTYVDERGTAASLITQDFLNIMSEDESFLTTEA